MHTSARRHRLRHKDVTPKKSREWSNAKTDCGVSTVCFIGGQCGTVAYTGTKRGRHLAGNAAGHSARNPDGCSHHAGDDWWLEGHDVRRQHQPIHVDSVTVGRSTFELIRNVGHYQGEISADGTSIRGIWIHGNPRPLDPPLALELRRATRHTAWSLPLDPSPHTTRYVTVDKDTNLEVLDWGWLRTASGAVRGAWK
jgi:hypothetical protein